MKFPALALLAVAFSACNSKPAAETGAAAPAPPAAATAPAAGDPAVDRTFNFVEKTLRLVGTNGTAAAAFSGQIETGGDPITYIASNMPDDAVFSPIAWERPTKPRSVVVRAAPGGYTIEAYLDDLATPVRAASVMVPPARRE